MEKSFRENLFIVCGRVVKLGKALGPQLTRMPDTGLPILLEAAINVLIEYQCPQCGAPATIEETDRLFTCQFCRVNSYL
ncbi:MAG: hypothetical protein PVH42_10930, partial [Desulfobacterales bacterium]